MTAEEPEIARVRHGIDGRLGRGIGIGQPGVPLRHEPGELVGGKAGERQVEAERPEVGHFQGEHAGIPAGVQGKLVVSNDVGAPLGLAHARELDDRYLGHAELSGRQ
jgi:hypothetical protein